MVWPGDPLHWSDKWYEVGNHYLTRKATCQEYEEGQRHRTERLKPLEERADSGTPLTDQQADRQDVRHRQGTQ